MNALYDYSLEGQTETSIQVYLTKPKLGYISRGASKLSLSNPCPLFKGCVYMYMYLYQNGHGLFSCVYMYVSYK